jgi:hypothetical protein
MSDPKDTKPERWVAVNADGEIVGYGDVLPDPDAEKPKDTKPEAGVWREWTIETLREKLTGNRGYLTPHNDVLSGPLIEGQWVQCEGYGNMYETTGQVRVVEAAALEEMRKERDAAVIAENKAVHDYWQHKIREIGENRNELRAAYEAVKAEVERLKTLEHLLSEPADQHHVEEMVRRVRSWGYFAAIEQERDRYKAALEQIAEGKLENGNGAHIAREVLEGK